MNKIENISGHVVDIVNTRIYRAKLVIEDGKIQHIIESDDVEDQYIMPGFIDAHIHIESSLLTPAEFARLAIRHGTIATISDPHEIANVLGKQGVEFMHRSGELTPFKFYFGAPSCVPATPFDNAGAELDAQSIEELIKQYQLKYISEMMNFPGVINQEKGVIDKLKVAEKNHLPVDGHIPGITGDALENYIRHGINTDHEAANLAEAEEKIRRGMKILIREGSAAKSFDELLPLIEKYPGHTMLCSDDIHPDDLLNGHMNLLVKRGVAKDVKLFDLLRTCILNPVRHYQLDVGLLRLHDDADFIVTNDLKIFEIKKTVIRGNLLFDGHQTSVSHYKETPLNKFVAKEINKSMLQVRSEGKPIHVIQAFDEQLETGSMTINPKTYNGYIIPDIKSDILKLVYVSRYQKSAPAVAFVHGFGFRKGAMATSISHDSHNIIAVGTNDEDIVEVINEIMKSKGGIAIKGDTMEKLPLRMAGIISDEPFEKVIEDYTHLKQKATEIGSKFTSPFMTLSFMALLVIPELKISEKGLFDVTKFEAINLHIKD